MVAMRYPSSVSVYRAPRAMRVRDGDVTRVVELSPGKAFVLGRSDRAEVPLCQSRVSRLHGMLWSQDDRWYYRDLGSANGSFVYEQADFDRHEAGDEDLPVEAVRDGESRELRAGEGVLLGTRRARLELLEEVPAAAWAARDPLVSSMRPIPHEPTTMTGLDDTTTPRLSDVLAKHG